MSENSSRKRFQRIVVILSGVALIGVSLVPLLNQLGQPSESDRVNRENTNPQAPNTAENEQLKQLEAGYQSVLEREPDNRVALQGLVEARARMNDFQGAKEPMEKLLALEPDNPVYLQTLAQINLRVNDLEGALQSLEKLAEIYPERLEIKEIIDTLQKAQRGELPEQSSPPVAPSPQPPSSLPSNPLTPPDLSIPLPDNSPLPVDPLAPPDLSIPLPSPEN
ncbi:MAG: tetratricopeptide repeat protein [Microcystaceae cyanobacterium]